MESKRCLSRLQKLCSKAEYCSKDMYRKALKDMEGDADAAASIVASLVEERYVDDVRFASAFAREKATLQGWGPVKIRFQLRSKGVPEAAISAALQEVEPQKAGDKLEKLLQSKARTLEGDPQKRLKLIKFGLTRGYEYDAIEKALDSVQSL
ncbi:MAG: RecX family transcriptional regulator [Bacteroidales bacterium]|nr:RecX family transcriptional regulator [Bacteroidales bacterium]